jgi:hypothetical protein
MIWIQGLICFAIWIAYGFVQSRRSDQIRGKISGQPRSKRAIGGAVIMLLGAGILFGVLVTAHSLGGFTDRGMTIPTFIAIAVAGLGFVHAQTMAMAMLVTLMLDGVVTSGRSSTSDLKGSDVVHK